ncbi:50S ribosomal protein L29 [Candidatus Uhrbacteria bacterium]|nr:50S ribosomal protein L29 [Candidatus Uhrbacteria bacterium]
MKKLTIPQSKTEIMEHIARARNAHAAMRYECAVGQRKDVREMRALKKEIAQLETALRTHNV